MSNSNKSSQRIDNVLFTYGQVLHFAELPSNSLALDGAVQGPTHDPATRRFSLDHHGGCLRSVTLATCQQTLTLLDLGLVVDEGTQIFTNDIDADTTLSVWLLLQARDGHLEALRDPRVRQLVEQVGLVDAHGPIYPLHPLHSHLGPRFGDKTPQTIETLVKHLAILGAWYEGLFTPAASTSPRSGRGYALRAGAATWEFVETNDGFRPLYERGYLAVALMTPAAEDTWTWTIAKRSDLVPLALGPADGSKDRSGAWLPTVLGALAKAEVERGCPTAETWGGGSSVGGSPRRPGGVGSRLTEAEVLTILTQFLIGQ